MKTKLFLLCFLACPLFAQADGTQPDGSGSPTWFSWLDFSYGWGAAWVVVGPMFIYWMMKRSAGNALS